MAGGRVTDAVRVRVGMQGHRTDSELDRERKAASIGVSAMLAASERLKRACTADSWLRGCRRRSWHGAQMRPTNARTRLQARRKTIKDAEVAASGPYARIAHAQSSASLAVRRRRREPGRRAAYAERRAGNGKQNNAQHARRSAEPTASSWLWWSASWECSQQWADWAREIAGPLVSAQCRTRLPCRRMQHCVAVCSSQAWPSAGCVLEP